jgi:hypothetical protein
MRNDTESHVESRATLIRLCVVEGSWHSDSRYRLTRLLLGPYENYYRPTRRVDVENVGIEELARRHRASISWGMSSGVVALLGTCSGAELRIECTLEDGTTKIRVVAVLVVRRVDSSIIVRCTRTVARNTDRSVAKISIGASNDDLEVSTCLAGVQCVVCCDGSSPQGAFDECCAGRVQAATTRLDGRVALEVEIECDTSFHGVTFCCTCVSVILFQGAESQRTISGSNSQ